MYMLKGCNMNTNKFTSLNYAFTYLYYYKNQFCLEKFKKKIYSKSL